MNDKIIFYTFPNLMKILTCTFKKLNNLKSLTQNLQVERCQPWLVIRALSPAWERNGLRNVYESNSRAELFSDMKTRR